MSWSLAVPAVAAAVPLYSVVLRGAQTGRSNCVRKMRYALGRWRGVPAASQWRADASAATVTVTQWPMYWIG